MGHQDPGLSSPKIDNSRSRDMGGGDRSRSREDRRDRGDRHKSSRRRSRSRDRSRSRSKRRSRDRSRSRSRRDRRSNFDADPAQLEAMQRYQQETIQKQLLAQQLMLQQQGLAGGLTAQKKQREVYVGNLTIGVVTDNHLKELFNGALAHLVPDPVANPPVVSAQLDPSGRFGFVEMRSEELASSAMQLDKVEVCGRQINVGRPKGYTEPPGGAAPAASLNAAQIFAASLARRPSTVLLLENMLKAYQLHDDSERNDLLEDVKEECSKYGTIHGIAVPKPPAHVRMQPGRVYIRFSKPEETEKAKAVFNGRQFDGNVVVAKEAPEEEFDRANAGQWTGGIDPPVAMYPVMTS